MQISFLASILSCIHPVQQESCLAYTLSCIYPIQFTFCPAYLLSYQLDLLMSISCPAYLLSSLPIILTPDYLLSCLLYLLSCLPPVLPIVPPSFSVYLMSCLPHVLLTTSCTAYFLSCYLLSCLPHVLPISLFLLLSVPFPSSPSLFYPDSKLSFTLLVMHPACTASNFYCTTA